MLTRHKSPARCWRAQSVTSSRVSDQAIGRALSGIVESDSSPTSMLEVDSAEVKGGCRMDGVSDV